MIRRMNGDDILPILELGKKLHAEIGDLPPIDEMGCKMLLARALCHKRQLVLVHEYAGEIVGVLFGVIEEMWFSKSMHATDVFFYSKHAGGAFMLRRFVRWAKGMGASEIDMAVSSGIRTPSSSRMFERIGFQNVGGIFRLKGNK